jgi:hypothetical protein
MSQTEADGRSIPTRHQLAAQRHVLVCVGDGAEKTALEASYPRIPTGGLISGAELFAAEQALVQAGLLLEEGTKLVPSEESRVLRGLVDDDFMELMVLTLLQAAPPLWLGPASGTGEIHEEFIPEGEDSRFTGLGLTPEQRDALLLAAGRKFEPTASTTVGAAGEVAVMEHYRTLLTTSGKEDLLASLIHVSLISDQLGYDIKAPDGRGASHRLEVKTCSTRGEEFTFYVSRNEADTGSRDPSWRIVVCRYVDETAEVVGWVSFSAVESLMPADPPGRGRWASVQITLHRSALTAGLPIVLDCDGAR